MKITVRLLMVLFVSLGLIAQSEASPVSLAKKASEKKVMSSGAPSQSQLVKIVCANSEDDSMELIPVDLAKHKNLKDGQVYYQIIVSETMSVPYLGAISPEDNRIVSLDKSESTATQDALTDWDGNSGIRFLLPKGILGKANADSFLAFLEVYYDDIDQGSEKNHLKCEIAK